MHIHLPKPLHGWREFVGEVGVIVLGVLIALAAEQGAELVRDRSKAAETRQNVRNEITLNLGQVLWRARSELCIAVRIREIETYLDSLQTGSPKQRPTWIGTPTVPLLVRDSWSAAQSTGTLFLVRADERTALSRFYIDFDDFNAADTREAYAWGQLRSIASSEVPPDSNDLTRLRSALQEAKTADWIVRSDTRELVRRARQSDLKPGKLSTQPDQTCVPATTPHDRAEAIVESAGDISWD